MRPTDNEQGDHYCMSLNIGRLLNRNNATLLAMPREFIDHVHRIAHRAPVGLAFADRNNISFPDISGDEKVVYVSNFDSDNSDNGDDTSKAVDPEAEYPEDSVDITGVDEQEYKHAGVVTEETKLEVVGDELEESYTPGVAEPAAAVIFDENPYEIIYAPIDEPTVPKTLPDPPPN